MNGLYKQRTTGPGYEKKLLLPVRCDQGVNTYHSCIFSRLTFPSVRFLGLLLLVPVFLFFMQNRAWGQTTGSQTFGNENSGTNQTHTFTVPAGVTSITVQAWGGGGAGGGNNNNNFNGGGGGGGGYAIVESINVTPETDVSMTVGTRGVALENSGNGGNTSVAYGDITIIANGGRGGTQGGPGDGGSGGDGDITGTTTGVIYTGGDGTDGSNGDWGGGGGSSAGNGSAGNDATNRLGADAVIGGGPGGNGNTNGNGFAPDSGPGGGGGGARNPLSSSTWRWGGDGASGQVIITWCYPPTLTSPTNQTVIYGGNASFSITATGTGTLSYQWQVNDGSGWVNIGTNSYILDVTLPTVAMSDNQYRCVVTDDCGSFAVSDPANLTVNKATPNATLAVTNSPVTYDGNPQSASVEVSASSVPGSVANITNGTHTDAGTYAVTADFVPTDAANYNSLTGLSAGNFVIEKATPTATLAVTNSPVTYDGNPQSATVVVSASSVPGSVTNIANGTHTDAGTYAVTADFVPTDAANYNSLTGLAAGDFVIGKAATTTVVTITGAPFTYTGSPIEPATVSVTGPGGLNLTPAANYTNNTDAGTATASYTYAETANYLGSSDSKGFTIDKAIATVTLAGLSYTYDGTEKQATTTTVPAGLTVNITYDGGTELPVDAGTYAVVATINDANYEGSATDNLVIGKAATTTVVTITGAPFTYTGSPIEPATVSVTGPGGLNLTPAANYTNNTDAGTATASYTYAETANYLGSSDSKGFTIDKAIATVTLAGLSYTYDGTEKQATTTTVPAGLTVNITYDGGTELPVDAGTYAVVATIDDDNYTGTASGNLVIDKADLSVTAIAGNITYGDPEPTVTVQYSGFENSEDESVLDDVGFTLGPDYTQGDAVGTYNTTIAMGTATDNNYNFTPLNTSTFEVGTLAITITADAKSKTYGEADPALTHQITSGSIYGSDAPTGALSRVAGEDVGTYAIQQNDLTYGSNYDETYVGADLTIGKADLAVTAVAGDITYGDATPAVTLQYSGFENSEDESVLDDVGFTLGTDYTQGDNVGTYNTTIAMGTATDNNYNFTPLNTSTFEVGTLAITITADAKSKTYGEADPALTHQITSGSIYGSDAPTGALSRVAGEDVGTYAIQQNDLTYGSNYDETYAGADLTIGKADLAVTAVAGDITYGDAAPAVTLQYSGFENSEDESVLDDVGFALGTDYTQGDNVGTYNTTIAMGSATDNNYNLNLNTSTFNVGVKDLTLSNFVADSKTYDGNTTVLSGDGFDDDRFSGDDLEFTYDVAFADANVGTNKAVNFTNIIISGGDDAGNYNLVTTSGTAYADITESSASVTLAGLSYTYDGTAKQATATTTPAGLAVNITYDGGAVLPIDAGTYVVVATIDDANYEGSATDNLEIGKANLLVTAVAANITYGDAAPTVSVQYSGFVNNEDESVLDDDGFTLGTDYTQGDDVGTYNTTISAGTATDNNYNFTPLNTSTFEVGSRDITITADAKSKIYGEADPALTHQITSGNIYGSDAPTGALSRVAGEDVGTYAIQQNDLTYGSNYNETYVGADLTIGKADLAVTAVAGDITYGDPEPTVSVQYSGFVNSEDESVLDNTGFSLSNNYTQGDNVGTYNTTIAMGSATDNNYNFTPLNTSTFEVGTRDITITADAKGKIYGAADPALTYQITSGNIYGSDAPTGALSRVAGEDVGTYAIQQNDLTYGSNYNETYVGADLTIGAKTLTPQILADNKCFDGTTDVTLSSQTLDGVESGDVVSLEVTSSNFANVGPGTGITVTASGLSLSGTDAGNYSVASTATTTADIFELPTATISGDASICEGESATITVHLTGTANWILTFQLDGINYLTVENIDENPYTFYVTQAGVYTVSAVSDVNCTGTTSGSATITVNPLPAEPSLTSNSPVCPGTDAVFTISGTPGNEVTYSGAATGTATVGTGGTAEVTVAGIISDVTLNLTIVSDGTCTRTLSGISETVVVEDNEAPVPDIATLPDVTAECEINTLTAPTATDNCAGTVTGTHNASLPVSSQGTTEVTWSFDDGNGNISTQTQNVVIEDVTNPTITCPPDVTVTVDENQCTATGVVLGTPVTDDNCGVASVTNDATEPFPIGDNTVTWSVEDIAGNTATCKQTVTVTPEEIIDIQVADLGDFCQSGETGSTTEIIWQVNLLAGTNNLTFDYTINDGTSDIVTETGVTATGNTTVTYSLTNETAVHKTLTLTITNVADACGVGESNTTNNSDSVTAFGVPDTSDITTN